MSRQNSNVHFKIGTVQVSCSLFLGNKLSQQNSKLRNWPLLKIKTQNWCQVLTVFVDIFELDVFQIVYFDIHYSNWCFLSLFLLHCHIDWMYEQNIFPRHWNKIHPLRPIDKRRMHFPTWLKNISLDIGQLQHNG